MYQPAPTGVSVDPIISRLRPRTVAEVLDHAFRLYRQNFLTFIAILAIVHVPLQLIILASTLFLVGDVANLQADLESSNFNSSNLNETFSYLGVIYVVILGVALLGGLIQKLSEASLTAAVADSHLDRPVTFGSSYRQMLQRIGPLLGLIVLQTLITIAVFIPFFLLFLFGFGLSFGDNTAGLGGGLICFGCVLIPLALVAIAYISIRLTITTPALMIEKLGPIDSIRRSWGLIQGFWWRTFALQIVLMILGWVVQVGPGAVVQGIVGIFAPRDLILQQVISGFITTLTTLVFLPIQLIAITLYYFDLRVRKEGYDLEAALTQRYSTPPPPTGYGGYGQTQPVGAYGQPQSFSDYYQPQLGQTQPTGGYNPPVPGAEYPGSYSGYGPYISPELPPQQPTYGDDSPPETPRQPESDAQPDAPPSPEQA